MAGRLFTIGHSNHPLEHFLGLLAQHRINVLYDVRSVPYSRRHPQFNRESLNQTLHAAGIHYVFLGKELGARSENPEVYIDGKVQYSRMAKEPAFQHGLRKVQESIDEFCVALMCAERDPLQCHRTILVCHELKSSDMEIVHILGDGSLETNDAAERRLMTTLRIAPDMLTDEKQCIEAAYREQAQRIAFVAKDAH